MKAEWFVKKHGGTEM